jgi:hypothetical protein
MNMGSGASVSFLRKNLIFHLPSADLDMAMWK